MARAGGSFGVQVLPRGFPALLPGAAEQTIRTIHVTDLLFLLKPKHDTQREITQKACRRELGLYSGTE